MSYERPAILSITVEPASEAQATWVWAIYREPDQMLLVRSKPEYANHHQALEAARAAAKNVSRKLSIPFAINDLSRGDRTVMSHDVKDAPD